MDQLFGLQHRRDIHPHRDGPGQTYPRGRQADFMEKGETEDDAVRQRDGAAADATGSGFRRGMYPVVLAGMDAYLRLRGSLACLS